MALTNMSLLIITELVLFSSMHCLGFGSTSRAAYALQTKICAYLIFDKKII